MDQPEESMTLVRHVLTSLNLFSSYGKIVACQRVIESGAAQWDQIFVTETPEQSRLSGADWRAELMH